MAGNVAVIDGTEAIAHVAHKVNEVIAIYPITPSSPIAEHADAWSAAGKKNLWGSVPMVVEMQSEAGRGGRGARGPSGRVALEHVHRLPGPAAHDPHHVQGGRRADAHLLARDRPLHRRPGPVHLRRPPGRHGRAADRVRPACVGFGAGGPRPGSRRARPPRSESRIPFIHFCDGFRTSHEVQKI